MIFLLEFNLNTLLYFRTNNAVESYNSRWNDTVIVRHPNIWLFIDHLKSEQAVMDQLKRQMENGEEPNPRKRKWRDLEHYIKRQKRLYLATPNNNTALTTYWEKVQYAIKKYQ